MVTTGFRTGLAGANATEIIDLSQPPINYTDYGLYPMSPIWRSTGGLLFHSVAFICGGWEIVSDYIDGDYYYNQYNYEYNYYDEGSSSIENIVDNRCYKLWLTDPAISDPPEWETLTGTMTVITIAAILMIN